MWLSRLNPSTFKASPSGDDHLAASSSVLASMRSLQSSSDEEQRPSQARTLQTVGVPGSTTDYEIIYTSVHVTMVSFKVGSEYKGDLVLLLKNSASRQHAHAQLAMQVTDTLVMWQGSIDGGHDQSVQHIYVQMHVKRCYRCAILLKST